jgi:dipeptidyl aminopeptidase/acylaminoacyl peptidase
MNGFVPILAVLAAVPAAAAPFTATEMMKLQRLADPQVSPDGKWVLYSQTEVDLAANARNSDLWIVPVAGGAPRRLTRDARSDTRGRWSPDGRRVPSCPPAGATGRCT